MHLVVVGAQGGAALFAIAVLTTDHRLSRDLDTEEVLIGCDRLGCGSGHLVVVLPCAGHVAVEVPVAQRPGTVCGGDLRMQEDIPVHRRTPEMIDTTERCDQVRARLEGRIRDVPLPLSDGVVRVLDPDRPEVRVPVSRVPRGIGVPDELPDRAIHIDLVVRRCLAVDPYVVDLIDR